MTDPIDLHRWQYVGDSSLPHRLDQLVDIGLRALFWPPKNLLSVFGLPASWLPPIANTSDYQILNPSQPLRASDYLADTNVPAFDHQAKGWAQKLPKLIQDLFWRPSKPLPTIGNEYQTSSDIDSELKHSGNATWLFVNGIATNEALARDINARYISDLFKTPVTPIYNSTQSVGLDLFQCVLGKSVKLSPQLRRQQSMTEPAYVVAEAVFEKLFKQRAERLIIFAHSQGSIIMANVMRALNRAYLDAQGSIEKSGELGTAIQACKTRKQFYEARVITHFQQENANTAEQITKLYIERLQCLELYLFANCADRFTFSFARKNQNNELEGLPYIENFGNEFDIVARLGMQSPIADKAGIEIDGKMFVREKGWGHLLNEHYLIPLIQSFEQNSSTKQGQPAQTKPKFANAQDSRLYQYWQTAQN